MAWHRSREKRLKQSKKKHSSNYTATRKIKQLNKKLATCIEEKKTAEAEKLLPQITKAYHTTAKRGILNSKTASRHISRTAKRVNSLAGKK